MILLDSSLFTPVSFHPEGRLKTPYLLAIGTLTLLLVGGCASNPKGLGPLDTVAAVDIQRYLGRWYEIARFQHGFEKSIVGATAEYSLREDGRIQVLNSGFKKELNGTYSEVKAVAWVPDTARPGALKVRFFGMFTSDYLIFGLDQENYSWALVGLNTRDYLWFLARTPEISEELFFRMKDSARGQGYDLTGLYKVPQKAR
jgi:apolipoprotein D and lipocalin family protein